MQVSVISTPSASNAAMARRSSSSIQGCVLEPMRGREIGAARIRDGRDAHPPLLGRQARHALEPLDAGDAERLGVGHDVGLRHRHEILGAEIVSDLDLMLDRPLRRRAECAGAHRLFLRRSAASSRRSPRRPGSAAPICRSRLRTRLPSACGVRLCRRRQIGAERPRSRFAMVSSRIALSSAALTCSTIGCGVPFGSEQRGPASVSSAGSPASVEDGTFGRSRPRARRSHRDRLHAARQDMRRRRDAPDRTSCRSGRTRDRSPPATARDRARAGSRSW